tara:strand:- start:165 stop:1235 length:1071 start_codon:yes stop_codon:yes gene_type:complete
MAIDKKIDYEIQGGVRNYRPSEMVTAPKIAKSSPNTPTAKLAYITPEEEKILVDLNLYGSLKGKPNRGPSGLPSLEGDFGGPGGFGGFQGGGDYSSAETGNLSGFSGTGSGPALPPGVTPKPSDEAKDIRSAFIAAGGGRRVNPGFFDSRNRVSPIELARARAFNPDAFTAGRGGIGSFISSGGFIGNLIRGLGQRLGLGKRFNQPTYDMSQFNKLGLGGLDPFANLDIRDIYDRRKTNEEDEDRVNLNDFEGLTSADFISNIDRLNLNDFSENPMGFGDNPNKDVIFPSQVNKNTGVMKLTEVLQKDIDASKARGFKKLDRDTAVSLGLISPNVTEYEFEQLKEGNITEPGTYTI